MSHASKCDKAELSKRDFALNLAVAPVRVPAALELKSRHGLVKMQSFVEWGMGNGELGIVFMLDNQFTLLLDPQLQSLRWHSV